MSGPLPTGKFCWEPPKQFSEERIKRIDRNGKTGYLFSVDLEYPKKLHNLHNEFPVCPEHMKVQPQMLSPYQQEQLKKLGVKPNHEKLISTLYDKKDYVCHLWSLQQALELGLKIKKIHKVLSFSQSNWLESYIRKNTDLRRDATNQFDVDRYKLMNNSFYGKCVEVRYFYWLCFYVHFLGYLEVHRL